MCWYINSWNVENEKKCCFSVTSWAAAAGCLLPTTDMENSSTSGDLILVYFNEEKYIFKSVEHGEGAIHRHPLNTLYFITLQIRQSVSGLLFPTLLIFWDASHGLLGPPDCTTHTHTVDWNTDSNIVMQTPKYTPGWGQLGSHNFP